MSSNPAALLPDASGEILQQLDLLRQRTQEANEDIRRIEQEQEAFALEYHELTKIQANITHLQNQAPSQQKNEFDKTLRMKKEMSEQRLNLKVINISTSYQIKLLCYVMYLISSLSCFKCEWI